MRRLHRFGGMIYHDVNPHYHQSIMPALPNIVYLHSHDTGRYIQPYGHATPTPTLQRLAEQGTLFRKAFSAAPTCSPSRAALLSGQYAHYVGMTGLVNRGWTIDPDAPTLISLLNDAGYTTALTGIQHIARDPQSLGYGVTQPGKENVERRAAEFLDSKPDKPFFLDAGFWETHRVFPDADQRADECYVAPPAPLPDTPLVRKDMAEYNTMAATLDDKIAVVLDALDRNGYRDNTIVIFTTDHGIAFPGMKCQLTDHGIGVSLIMRGPGFEPGAVVDEMVSHVDVLPTLCECIGLDAPDWAHGRSFMPLLRGEVESHRDELFAEVTYHGAYDPRRGVRTQRYKYIRQFDDRGRICLSNCDAGYSKDYWVKQGWSDVPRDNEQLYDLVFDPNETNNLAGEARCAEILADLRGRLDRWMHDTNDPLLNGPVPPPAGALVTDADADSASGPAVQY